MLSHSLSGGFLAQVRLVVAQEPDGQFDGLVDVLVRVGGDTNALLM
jgi:hypothetical protein